MIKSWLSSLRLQIALLLTVALLPLGGIAIYQTNKVAEQAEGNADLALLALTGQAAKVEELAIENALGSAQFLASIADTFINDPARCGTDLPRFVAENDRFSFIGILPLSGLMTCSSAGEAVDFSNYETFDGIMAAQTRSIVANAAAPLSGQSVFIVSEPYSIDGAFAGFVSVSVPHAILPETTSAMTALGLKELITVNAAGEILISRGDRALVRDQLPSDRDIAGLIAGPSEVFDSRDRTGQLRTYTTVPIEGSPATVIGIWQQDSDLSNRAGGLIEVSVFPVLMWFASMAVAMLSVYMLVLRHVNRLRFAMGRFSKDRTISRPGQAVAMPSELLELNEHFDEMTQSILRDEASIEDALHEKNVLIKEVHHRVKNNLQLISSIMNMQIRSAHHDETKTALSRLQDRVRSLARIHQDLYQPQSGGRVDVGALLTDIIENSAELAISNSSNVKVETDIDKVLLYPDQAVPLSLSVAEATTNAMKFLGAAPGETPHITARLKQVEDRCEFVLTNSVGGASDAESTGLGAQLLNAFVIQLGGKMSTEDDGQQFTLRVTFTSQEFAPEVRDY